MWVGAVHGQVASLRLCDPATATVTDLGKFG